MQTFDQRTIMAIGEDNYKLISNLSIIVFGVGGVGGATAEYLARLGVKELTIVDSDNVNITNINRQIVALSSTIGLNKLDVLEARLKDINPNISIRKINKFIKEEDVLEMKLENYDYIIDAIDTVSTKLALIEYSYKNKIRIISSMGAGNRIDPSKISISDISKTSYDPLAKVIRQQLKKRNIFHLKVCFTIEPPFSCSSCIKDGSRNIPGSVSYMPSVFAAFIVSEVVKDIIGK